MHNLAATTALHQTILPVIPFKQVSSVGESVLVQVYKSMTSPVTGPEAGAAMPDEQYPKIVVLRNFLSKDGNSFVQTAGCSL